MSNIVKKIKLEELMCHGVSGFKGYFSELLEETRLQLADSINYINEPYKNSILNMDECISHPEIIFSLFRLQQILQSKEISTLKDLKEKEGSFIINSGKKIGAYNSEDEICFSMKNQDFYPKRFDVGFSNDVGDSFVNFIEKGFSIMIPKDSTFDAYKKSENFDGIFHDEIRIEGSIKDPKIKAIGLPIIRNLRFKNDKQFEDYCKIVKILRNMLNCFGYNDVKIVDSFFGYNLEWDTTITTFREQIKKSKEFRERYWSNNTDHEFEDRLEKAMNEEIKKANEKEQTLEQR